MDILIPILAGSGPPIFPGAQPEVISGDPKSKRSHDNWLRKANAFGSFVVAVYCPWDITSGMPPYELSWKGLQEWIKTELLESKHFVDQARVKWIRNVATGFTVDKRVLKLIAEWRGRSATRWSKEPGSKDDALQYGSEGLLYKGREGSGAHIEDDAAYLEANLMLQFILMQDLKKGTAAGAKLDSDLLSSLDPSSVAIAQDKKSEQKRKDREVLNQSLEWLQTLHEPYKEFAAPSSSSPLSAEEVNRGLLNRDDDDPATIEEGGDTRNKVLTSGKLWQREQVFLLPHSTKTSVKEMRATLGAIDKDEKKYMRPTGATAVTNNHGNNNKSGEDRKTSDVDDGSSRDGSSSGGRFMSSATLHNRLLLGESGGFTMNSGNRSMSSSSLQQQPAKPLPWFFTIFPTRDLITAKLRASSDYSRPFLELSQEQLIVVEKILVWLHKDYCFQQKQQQLSMMPLPSTTSSKMFTRQDASKLMSKEINTKSDITPLCLSVHGGPGSGKSTALNALLKLLKDCNAESLLRIATPTGIAATAISSGATTIHRLFGWIPGTANYRGAALKNKDQMDRFVQTFEGVRLIIIDEMSMISQEDLFQINCALQGAYGGIKGTTSVGNEPVGVEGLAGSEQDLFGGLGIVLTGDFFQLPCVGGTPLYKPARKTSLNYYDNFQVLMFNQQQRAAKDMSHSTALEKLRDISDTTTPLAKHEFILSSIRPISSDDLRDILTYEDYHKQSHDALSPSSSYEDYLLSLWHFAPIVTPSNENVFAFNLHQVCRFAKMSGKPVLAFQLPLRGEQVKEILGSNSKIKGSLYAKFPQLWFYFVPGAPARINVNICVQLGIANGTPCRLVSVILSNDADRDQAHQAYMNAKPGDIVRLEYTPEAMCVAVELNDTMNHLSTAATTEDVQDSSAPLFATNSTTTVVDSFSRPFLTKTKVQTIIDHNKKSTSSLVNATAGSRNNAKDIFFVRHHHHTQQRHSTTTATRRDQHPHEVIIPLTITSSKEDKKQNRVVGHLDDGSGRTFGSVKFSPMECELAFSCTYHKVQSLTMEKVILDLNHNRSCPITLHHFIVGFSRVRSSNGIRCLKYFSPRDEGVGNHTNNTPLTSHLLRLTHSPSLVQWYKKVMNKESGPAYSYATGEPKDPVIMKKLHQKKEANAKFLSSSATSHDDDRPRPSDSRNKRPRVSPTTASSAIMNASRGAGSVSLPESSSYDVSMSKKSRNNSNNTSLLLPRGHKPNKWISIIDSEAYIVDEKIRKMEEKYWCVGYRAFGFDHKNDITLQLQRLLNMYAAENNHPKLGYAFCVSDDGYCFYYSIAEYLYRTEQQVISISELRQSCTNLLQIMYKEKDEVRYAVEGQVGYRHCLFNIVKDKAHPLHDVIFPDNSMPEDSDAMQANFQNIPMNYHGAYDNEFTQTWNEVFDAYIKKHLSSQYKEHADEAIRYAAGYLLKRNIVIYVWDENAMTNARNKENMEDADKIITGNLHIQETIGNAMFGLIPPNELSPTIYLLHIVSGSSGHYYPLLPFSTTTPSSFFSPSSIGGVQEEEEEDLFSLWFRTTASPTTATNTTTSKKKKKTKPSIASTTTNDNPGVPIVIDDDDDDDEQQDSSRLSTMRRSSSPISLFITYDSMNLDQKQSFLELKGFRLNYPLTRIQKQEVKRIIYNTIPGEEVMTDDSIVVSHYNIDFKYKDFKRFQPKTWLSDEAVNFYVLMLQHRVSLLRGKADGRRHCHFYNTFFLTKLLENNQYSFAQVQRWSKKIACDLFDLDKLFIPINIRNVHWTLCVVYIQFRIIRYFDSSGGSGRTYMNIIMQYLSDEARVRNLTFTASEWQLEDMLNHIPQQENGYDCGLFVIVNADYLSDDLPLDYSATNEDMAEKRLQVAYFICQKVLPYPTEDYVPYATPVVRVFPPMNPR